MVMGLGSLATLGLRPCANLTLVVIDNGQFGETGQQTSHTGYGLALAEIASTCGFDWCREITDMSVVGGRHGLRHGESRIYLCLVTWRGAVYVEDQRRGYGLPWQNTGWSAH